MRWQLENSGDSSTPRLGPSRGAPPTISPTCPRFALPAAASAATVSEHPCVKLDQWWLARVEGDERKIAVAGVFERNQAVLDFAAAPIAKRYEPYVLETDNGTVLLISGLFNIDRTLENGFTIEVCEKFSHGFPQWWEKCNVLHPKMTSSQTGSRTRSSTTDDTREDSSRFYLQMFQNGKLLDSFGPLIYKAHKDAEAFAGNSAAFPDSTYMPNGAPRFEEYTSDDDTPAIEKSAASNHECNKVENMETSTLEEGSHDGTDCNIPSASMAECTNDEGNAGLGNASCIKNCRQKAHLITYKRRGCLKKPQRVALSESVPGEDTQSSACSYVQSSEKGKQPVGPSRKQRSTFRKLQRATRASKIRSPIPYRKLSPLARGRANSLSVSTPESLKLKKTRSGRVVVPALDRGCQNIFYAPDGSIAYIIGMDSSPPLRGSTSRNYARRKNYKTAN